MPDVAAENDAASKLLDEICTDADYFSNASSEVTHKTWTISRCLKKTLKAILKGEKMSLKKL